MRLKNSKLFKAIKDFAPEILESLGSVIPPLNVVAKLIKGKSESVKKVITDAYEQDLKIQAEITARWKSDNRSDSWLAKNVRPIVLLWFVFIVSLLCFLDSYPSDFTVENHWVSMFGGLLTTIIVAYFGSRGIEKIKDVFKK